MDLRAIGIFLGGIAVGGFVGYMTWGAQQGNYDECVVAEMRGLSQNMILNVMNLCARRFGKEVDVPVSETKVEWDTASQKGRILVSIFIASKEYEVTEGSFRFSPKLCNNSSTSDFGSPITKNVVNGIAAFPLKPEPHCMRTISLKGKFK